MLVLTRGETLQICVLGAGALGSVIAGRLARAGHAVTVVNRNAAYVECVGRDGLALDEGGAREIAPVVAVRTPAGLPPTDLLIVLVKAFDTEAALGAALGMVGPDTIVLSLQNGLGNEDLITATVGPGHVIAGKTYVGGVMTAPGVVMAGTRGKETVIGELDGRRSERVHLVAEVFAGAGLASTVSDNIRGVIWDKLLVNVATGALAAITRLNYGNLYDVPEIEPVALAAVAEAMAVARAEGVEIATETPREAWRKAGAGLGFGFKTSMLQSLEKGSITEIDAINGAVVRAGAAVGIATPVNATLAACIKGIERAMAPKLERA